MGLDSNETTSHPTFTKIAPKSVESQDYNKRPQSIGTDNNNHQSNRYQHPNNVIKLQSNGHTDSDDDRPKGNFVVDDDGEGAAVTFH